MLRFSNSGEASPSRYSNRKATTMTTSEIFALAAESNVQMHAYIHLIAGSTFMCGFKSERDGTKIETSAESKVSMDEAISAAWTKFEGFARHGNPRLLAPMITASTRPIEPIGITDDGVPF